MSEENEDQGLVNKINEKTVISLHVVIFLLGIVTWGNRASDKVERNELAIHELQESSKEKEREYKREIENLKNRLTAVEYGKRRKDKE